MKIREVFFIVLGIFLVFGAGYFLYLENTNIVNAPANPVTTGVKTEIKFEDKKILDNTEPLEITITYPYIAGLDGFNQKVKDIVDKELKDFKEISLENDQARKNTDPIGYEDNPVPYYLSIAYEKGEVNENIASIALIIETYTGGAHGAHYPISVNYDFKNKKEIKLTDLFPGQKDYLQKISSYCVADLTKQIKERIGSEDIDTDWIDRGAGPIEENFSVFLINKDNIVFYFPEYQIAAYAVGSFTVTMPRQ